MTNSIASQPTSFVQVGRGLYKQIIKIYGGRAWANSVTAILHRFAPALPAKFIEFDKKGRGDAVNHDLYGYDLERDLAVIQVRQASRTRANGFLNVRKSYFLVGFTETGEPFRHPVEPKVVQKASQNDGDPADVVRAAERWIFQVTAAQYSAGLRQGDVFMYPVKRRPPKTAERVGLRLSVLETHEIRALDIVRDSNGKIYAYDPRLYHLKGQHDTLYATTVDQWWVIVPGREARTYDFAERLGD